MKLMDERGVARLWKSGRLSRFIDDTGNEVEVIYAGRKSSFSGCDFQDAVIMINGKRVTGNIEVHVDSDLWVKHGHQWNPAYNGIVLHVVMWRKGELPVRLETGAVLPTVILSNYTGSLDLGRRKANRETVCKCMQGLRPSSLNAVLMNMGMRRFEAMTAGYASALRRGEAEQVLYRGVCRALGYSKNTGPFETIAQGLPASTIYSIAVGNEIAKVAVILGAAGFLQLEDSHIKSLLPPELVEQIEGTWRAWPDKPQLLSAHDWCFAGVRPGNHPVKRLAYLGSLLHKYEQTGMVRAFTSIIGDIASGGEAYLLEDALLLPGLLGRGRARDIIVNQVLPFSLAYAMKSGDFALASQAVYLYLNHASLPDNEVLRYMRSLLLMESFKDWKACIQQGILHIYHSHCRTKSCASCPVSICRRQGRESRPALFRPNDLT